MGNLEKVVSQLVPLEMMKVFLDSFSVRKYVVSNQGNIQNTSIKLFRFYFVYCCFACMYVFVPCVCLVPSGG